MILDQPDLMFGADDRKAEFGFAVPGYIFDPNPGSDARTPTLPTDARMAADHRRLVYVDNGDIWRAEWDWKNGALVNKKQVTTSGVFGGKSILVWYGNTILMRTEFNKARPILKLDLVTGQTEEMGTYGAIDYGMMVNRGGYLLFQAGIDTLYTYDLRNGEARLVPNTFRFADGTHWVDVSVFSQFNDKAVWLDNDTALVPVGGGWSATLQHRRAECEDRKPPGAAGEKWAD